MRSDPRPGEYKVKPAPIVADDLVSSARFSLYCSAAVHHLLLLLLYSSSFTRAAPGILLSTDLPLSAPSSRCAPPASPLQSPQLAFVHVSGLALHITRLYATW